MSLEFQREGSVLENLNLGVIREQMLFKPQNVWDYQESDHRDVQSLNLSVPKI